MFEDQIALERAQGHRGFATRFFGPIDSTAEAQLVIREMSIALLGLAGFQALMFESACHEGNHGMINILSAARAEEKKAAEAGKKP